jgi:hypothetical protein
MKYKGGKTALISTALMTIATRYVVIGSEEIQKAGMRKREYPK